MRSARVAVADLMLDGENPRHQFVAGQREAIRELLVDGGEKLVTLARDIAENGLSPIDTFLVVTNPQGLFTVLEGNRRIATLKLLHNPGLADGYPTEKRFRELASSANALPTEVSCAVAASRDEAKHWLELRHTGERGGAGVVEWSAEAKQRFDRRKGTQGDKALALIDAMTVAYSVNAGLQTHLATVRQDRLTTLGRLVADPYVRESLGITIREGEVLTHYGAKETERALARVVADLANSVTVTNVKTKAQRREYVDEIRSLIPKKAKYRDDPKPFTGTAKRPKLKPSRKPTSAHQPSKRLFDGLELQNLGSRVASILKELKRLDVDDYPNAAAVLVRCVLELSVDQVHDAKNWALTAELKNRVRKCLRAVDPTEKKAAFQAVRTGLSDGTSLLAVTTLHAYVHNPHYHPSGTEIRTIASNYAEFLKALDALI